MKDAQYHPSLGNCKLKWQWDSLLEWLKGNGGNTKCWQGCEVTGSLMLLTECETVELIWKKVCQFLMKLHIPLTYDPTIPLLGMFF